MEKLIQEDDWPEPREDPDEEPSEPWARPEREGDSLPDWIRNARDHDDS
jgi:hypothetical protein